MTDARFATYNLLTYGLADTPAERRRRDQVAEVISGLNANVVAVQEIVAPDETAAGVLLSELAESAGMRCAVEPGRCAVATGHKLSSGDRFLHTGLMWAPQTPLIPGTFHAFGAGDFWHSLTSATFDMGGTAIAHASHQAAPFGLHRRADEMHRVVSIMTRPDGRPPGTIAMDANSISADPRRDDTGLYDHDWHADQPSKSGRSRSAPAVAHSPHPASTNPHVSDAHS